MKIFMDTEFLEGTQTRRLMGIPIGKTKPTIELISIALVGEDGREYYGICKEFNLEEAWNRYDLDHGHGDARNHPPRRVYWFRNNILIPIFNDLMELDRQYCAKANRFGTSGLPLDDVFCYTVMKEALEKHGKTRKQIMYDVNEFICPIAIASDYADTGSLDTGFTTFLAENPPEFYAYFADYDWVAFCWLYGRMIDLPTGFPMYCRDIKQQLDYYIEEQKESFYKGDNWPHLGGGSDLTFDEITYFQNFGERLSKIKAHPDYPKQKDEHHALSDARWNKALYDFLKTHP